MDDKKVLNNKESRKKEIILCKKMDDLKKEIMILSLQSNNCLIYLFDKLLEHKKTDILKYHSAVDGCGIFNIDQIDENLEKYIEEKKELNLEFNNIIFEDELSMEAKNAYRKNNKRTVEKNFFDKKNKQNNSHFFLTSKKEYIKNKQQGIELFLSLEPSIARLLKLNELILMEELLDQEDVNNKQYKKYINEKQELIKDLTEIFYQLVFSSSFVASIVSIIEKDYKEEFISNFIKIRNLFNENGGSLQLFYQHIYKNYADENHHWTSFLKDLDLDIYSVEYQPLVEKVNLALSNLGTGKINTYESFYSKVAINKRKFNKCKYEIINNNLKIVAGISSTYFNRKNIDLNELIQDGNLGLIKAIDKFDYRRGFKFSTYASWWVRQSIARSIGDHWYNIRLPSHVIDSKLKINHIITEYQAINNGETPSIFYISSVSEIPEDKVKFYMASSVETISLSNYQDEEKSDGLMDKIPNQNAKNPENERLLDERSVYINNLLSQILSERELMVLKYRIGFFRVDNETNGGLTLDEIGEILGLTRERVRQIEKHAYEKIRMNPHFLQSKEILRDLLTINSEGVDEY